MFSLSWAWISCWTNNEVAGELKHHGAMNDTNIHQWPYHKSHNALDKYPTMHNFVTEMCTHVHISVTKWCIVWYGTGALWDLSSLVKVKFSHLFGVIHHKPHTPNLYATLLHAYHADLLSTAPLIDNKLQEDLHQNTGLIFEMCI